MSKFSCFFRSHQWGPLLTVTYREFIFGLDIGKADYTERECQRCGYRQRLGEIVGSRKLTRPS